MPSNCRYCKPSQIEIELSRVLQLLWVAACSLPCSAFDVPGAAKRGRAQRNRAACGQGCPCRDGQDRAGDCKHVSKAAHHRCWEGCAVRWLAPQAHACTPSNERAKTCVASIQACMEVLASHMGAITPACMEVLANHTGAITQACMEVLASHTGAITPACMHGSACKSHRCHHASMHAWKCLQVTQVPSRQHACMEVLAGACLSRKTTCNKIASPHTTSTAPSTRVWA
eukprot:1160480-Pelagomonas_calceolata.AAC.5